MEGAANVVGPDHVEQLKRLCGGKFVGQPRSAVGLTPLRSHSAIGAILRREKSQSFFFFSFLSD